MHRRHLMAHSFLWLALLLLALSSAACGSDQTDADAPDAEDRHEADGADEAGDTGGTDGSASDREDRADDPVTGDRVELTPGEVATVRGVVVENSFDPCREDNDGTEECIAGGGYYLVIDAGTQDVRVHYSFGMSPPCDNDRASRQGESARVGAMVEVTAEAVDEDHVSSADMLTCDSPDYSIEVLQAP